MVAKGFRTFIFGAVSVMTPIYLSVLGYSPFYVGLALFTVVAGNVMSNLLLTWYGNMFGRKKFLLVFSALMVFSGLVLFSTTAIWMIFLALFLGNISTTGTEAGPFQSIETGVMPSMVPESRRSRIFGVYNLIGYGASSVGALASSLPAYFRESIFAFRGIYLAYALVGLLLFMVYTTLNNIEASKRGTGLGHMTRNGLKDMKKLSLLFSMDAFGGGFVTQSIMSYWFYLAYHVSLKDLGAIFMVVNIITALSILGASFIAERIGNLRTMVFTHLTSSVFLIMIPFAGSLAGSLAFLFLRQSTSQMDVPTRQAFMAQIFGESERVSANAVTNTFRSISSLPGSPVVGLALSSGLLYIPYVIGGGTKMLYDASIFASYRKRTH
ncbi:MAG: MFS transporter [Nitrososphaerota archaeon]|jgi:MFS family permease|nr:MFS transporter [Nitrososphaerota archaeon]MDG6931189.1 MFS transporter [Nitrososphaerota archaeon]MDG6931852.1 MFS transporter [Nitrososphaerota archaeon]MDG6936628.1 MFS transporter [Nitrososphaerota archaeon]MDG6944422.1 MFS transporter [Nitrososphaerota archaeon]